MTQSELHSIHSNITTYLYHKACILPNSLGTYEAMYHAACPQALPKKNLQNPKAAKVCAWVLFGERY